MSAPATTPPQATLTERLAAFVGATQAGPGADYLQACASQATAMVDDYLGPARQSVPDPVLERAYLEVGADLWHRRTARNGVAGFEDTDLAPSPVRINRDPMAAAYPILRRYTGPAIA